MKGKISAAMTTTIMQKQMEMMRKLRIEKTILGIIRRCNTQTTTRRFALALYYLHTMWDRAALFLRAHTHANHVLLLNKTGRHATIPLFAHVMFASTSFDGTIARTSNALARTHLQEKDTSSLSSS